MCTVSMEPEAVSCPVVEVYPTTINLSILSLSLCIGRIEYLLTLDSLVYSAALAASSEHSTREYRGCSAVGL